MAKPGIVRRAGRAIMNFLGLRTKAADLLKTRAPKAAPARKAGGGGGRTP